VNLSIHGSREHKSLRFSSAGNSLLQNDALHSVDAGFDEAPHPATSTSPQKEKSHAAETEPPEDPRSIGTQLLKPGSFHSVKPNNLEALIV